MARASSSSFGRRVSIGCDPAPRAVEPHVEYEITAEPGYLKAELSGRETVAETRAFFRAVVLENRAHRRSAILLAIRSSRPIFNVEAHGPLEFFRELALDWPCRIALVGDSRELRLSNEYVALRARQGGVNVQSFADEAAALRWLADRRRGRDRRQRREPRPRQEQRRQMDRRERERRANPHG